MILNAVDTAFLLASSPDTDYDIPSAFIISGRTKRPVDREKLNLAVAQIDERYEDLCILSNFDPQKLSWIKAESKEDRTAVLDKAVTQSQSDIIDTINRLVKDNSYDYPIKICISEDSIAFRFHHAYCDATFAFKLVELIWATYSDVDMDSQVPAIPVVNDIDINLLKESIKGKLTTLRDDKLVSPKFTPINLKKIAANLHTEIIDIGGEELDDLNALKMKLSNITGQRISTNTLFNALLLAEFTDKGYQNTISRVSIPTSLHKYLEFEDKYYPSNFIAIMNIELETRPDAFSLTEACQTIQEAVDKYLSTGAIAQRYIDKTVEYEINNSQYVDKSKKGYLDAAKITEQSFVLSTVRVDSSQSPSTIQCWNTTYLSAPIIGTQPLSLYLLKAEDKYTLSYTYDTGRLTAEEVAAIIEGTIDFRGWSNALN